MFYFKIILTSLLAIASLSSLITIILTNIPAKKKTLFIIAVLCFAGMICLYNFYITEPEIHITQEYSTDDYKNYRDLTTQKATFKPSDGFQKFYLGLQNNSKDETYINPIIFLHFIDEVKIDSNQTRKHFWQETEPNEDYYFSIKGDLHPGTRLRTNALMIKLEKGKVYKVSYSVHVRDRRKIKGEFVISEK